MRDTPRTDVELFRIADMHRLFANETTVEIVTADFARELERESLHLAQALRDVLRYPMPHDLVAIRREVAREYDGDEEAAKEQMETWCSHAYMEQQVAAHHQAWNRATEALRGYGNNIPQSGAAESRSL